MTEAGISQTPDASHTEEPQAGSFGVSGEAREGSAEMLAQVRAYAKLASALVVVSVIVTAEALTDKWRAARDAELAQAEELRRVVDEHGPYSPEAGAADRELQKLWRARLAEEVDD